MLCLPTCQFKEMCDESLRDEQVMDELQEVDVQEVDVQEVDEQSVDVQVVEGALSKCRLRKLRIVSCVLSLYESHLLFTVLLNERLKHMHFLLTRI